MKGKGNKKNNWNNFSFIAVFIFCNSVNAASINLAIDVLRGLDSDNKYPAYGLRNQHIYKIYEINNGTQNYNRSI